MSTRQAGPANRFVAITSNQVTGATGALYRAVRRLGFTPVLVSRRGAQADISRFLGKRALKSSVLCRNIQSPIQASEEIAGCFRNKRINRASWINLIDG